MSESVRITFVITLECHWVVQGGAAKGGGERRAAAVVARRCGTLTHAGHVWRAALAPGIHVLASAGQKQARGGVNACERQPSRCPACSPCGIAPAQHRGLPAASHRGCRRAAGGPTPGPAPGGRAAGLGVRPGTGQDVWILELKRGQRHRLHESVYRGPESGTPGRGALGIRSGVQGCNLHCGDSLQHVWATGGEGQFHLHRSLLPGDPPAARSDGGAPTMQVGGRRPACKPADAASQPC